VINILKNINCCINNIISTWNFIIVIQTNTLLLVISCLQLGIGWYLALVIVIRWIFYYCNYSSSLSLTTYNHCRIIQYSSCVNCFIIVCCDSFVTKKEKRERRINIYIYIIHLTIYHKKFITSFILQLI
jgi:hypothetical protein